jgi:hypothetical protein
MPKNKTEIIPKKGIAGCLNLRRCIKGLLFFLERRF